MVITRRLWTDYLISKGYVTATSETPQGEKCTFHTMVLIIKEKPEVVFDCSAEFNNKSIKEQLISSPDLDNLFIDVLTRF